MTLREEIIEILMSNNDWPWTPGVADKILALIEGERCEWTRQIEDNHEYYTTSCDLVDLAYHTYCPKCGKRIELQSNCNRRRIR